MNQFFLQLSGRLFIVESSLTLKLVKVLFRTNYILCNNIQELFMKEIIMVYTKHREARKKFKY